MFKHSRDGALWSHGPRRENPNISTCYLPRLAVRLTSDLSGSICLSFEQELVGLFSQKAKKRRKKKEKQCPFLHDDVISTLKLRAAEASCHCVLVSFRMSCPGGGKGVVGAVVGKRTWLSAIALQMVQKGRERVTSDSDTHKHHLLTILWASLCKAGSWLAGSQVPGTNQAGLGFFVLWRRQTTDKLKETSTALCRVIYFGF